MDARLTAFFPDLLSSPDLFAAQPSSPPPPLLPLPPERCLRPCVGMRCCLRAIAAPESASVSSRGEKEEDACLSLGHLIRRREPRYPLTVTFASDAAAGDEGVGQSIALSADQLLTDSVSEHPFVYPVLSRTTHARVSSSRVSSRVPHSRVHAGKARGKEEEVISTCLHALQVPRRRVSASVSRASRVFRETEVS